MERYLYFVFFMLFPFTLCFAQSNISGYVYDRETGEPLIGVSVYTDSQNYGTFTNHAGYFYMNVPKIDTTAMLYFSYLGYRTYSRALKPVLNRQATIFLDKKDYSLNEVVISNAIPLIQNIKTCWEMVREVLLK